MNKFMIMILVLVFSFPQALLGQQVGGNEIMQQSFNRDDGKDGYFKIEMALIDKGGGQRKRILEIYTKDYGRLIKNFIKFTEPPDIKGTSFLSWENENGDDTQYLYLPELGRARRIVSSQKDLRFVNTDFTYEDMQRRKPDKDEHKLLAEEDYSGRPCFVVESLPKDNSLYSKRVSWVDKESSVIVKIEFYNKRGDKFKIFKVEGLEKKSGIWTAVDTVMEDLSESHKTLMKMKEVKYNRGLDDGIFTQENLERH